MQHTTPIDHLASKASGAVPPVNKRRQWDHLLPVMNELRTKGFTIRQAVEWLQKEGAVGAEDGLRALNAFTTMLSRQKRQRS